MKLPIPFVRSWDGMPWDFTDTFFFLLLIALVVIGITSTVVVLTSHHQVRYHCVQETRRELICTRR